jgi:signal transduction histidine kinase
LERSIVLSGSASNYVVVEYRDDGVGIPHEYKKSVFDGKLGAESHEKRAGSLGLGLPLTRNLLRKIGGDVTELGEPGAGVHFLLVLKIQR